MVTAGLRVSTSNANTAMTGGTNTTRPKRRSALRSNGLSRNSQNVARMYQSGWDIQPPSHAEPCGSPSGTIQKMMLLHGTAVRGDGSSSHATRIATNATAANAQRGRRIRRARSASTRGHGRRSSDFASSDPATKNIVGTAAIT